MLSSNADKARNYLLIIGCFFILSAAGSLYFNLSEIDQQYRELALNMGRTYYHTLIASRRWNAEHEGVYVPVHETFQPNPYLEDPLRDLTTTSGIRLTKVNPAYMTRLTSEMLEKEKGVHLHLTSLNPINPKNAPDSWERDALEKFALGRNEYHSVRESGQEAVFRYMAPVKTEQSCLKCHAKHGYHIGDIRGAISVSFSYSPFLSSSLEQKHQTFLTHLFFLVISLSVTFLLGMSVIKGIRRLQESLQRIKKLEGILPVCAKCKKMRIEHADPRDQKSWVPFEQYITERTEASFTHGICPSCAHELYGDFENQENPKE